MNVGIVGIGIMGRNHIRVYSEFKDVNEIYIFDLNKNNASMVGDYAIVCKSVKELLNSVDAVSICTSTRHHFDVAKKAIEKGVHCLIEKPVTSTVKEGERLLDLLKGKDVIVGVGHIERFNPLVAEITKIVGEPAYVEIKRHNPASARITDSSVVEDLMIHDIDIVFNVLFRDKKSYRIYAAGNRNLCKAIVVFDNSFASLSASRMASKKIRTVYIEDEEFTLEGDFMAQEVYIYRKPEKYETKNERYIQENVIEKVLVNKLEPLKLELRTFIDCVKKNENFPVTPEQALANLKICEKIERCFK